VWCWVDEKSRVERLDLELHVEMEMFSSVAIVADVLCIVEVEIRDERRPNLREMRFLKVFRRDLRVGINVNLRRCFSAMIVRVRDSRDKRETPKLVKYLLDAIAKG
jgi:hypothetical protein